MKKIVLILVILVSLLSCNENPVAKPKKLLDEETMENILYDVAILQAMQTTAPQDFSALNTDVKQYIYNKYNIDSVIYNQNNKYYAGDVRAYKFLNKRVIERLQEAKKLK
jgi:Domain of unknown function (DUF4296)